MPFSLRYALIIIVSGLIACSKPPVSTSNPKTLSTPKVKDAPAPALVSVGSDKFTKADLIIDLENNLSLDSSSNQEIIAELTKRKLFLAEARDLGMDQDPNYQEQIISNAKLALSKILEDKKSVQLLADEAYARYLKEINASYIFIPLSAYAPAADTLKIYNELLKIRDLAIKNNDFATQAKRWSKDPKTAQNGGNLGWFTVFKLFYPLENAVYSTPKESISLPVRTDLGYFIIKVNDTRKNSGTVTVQHIFKAITPQMSASQISGLYNQLDSIRNTIENGTDFEEMVLKYSDDFNSRDSKGELAAFGVGRTEEAFEEACFDLKKGEISKPVQSSTGLHLIRLLDKSPVDSKAKFLEENYNKLTTDSRAEFLNKKRIDNLKSRFSYKLNQEVLDNAMRFASIRILNRNWAMPQVIDLEETLLAINEKKYSVKDFYNYVIERQEFEKWPNENPNDIFNMLFSKFLDSILIQYEEEITLKQNPEVRRWLSAQAESILYSEFYDKYILAKSLNDTLGQKQFYELNRAGFSRKQEGEISVMSFADEEVYKRFKKLAASPKPYRLFRGISPILYPFDIFTLNPEEQRKLQGLIEFMYQNPGYIVEVAGHIDAKESEVVSELRIKEVVNFLVKNGLPLTRIIEVNHKSSTPLDRFDWSKNQAVTFQFFSNAEKDLAKTFNSETPNAVVYRKFKISKEDFESKMKSKWESKEGLIRLDGRVEEYSLKIKETKGTYKDFKAEVINAYQRFLENELIKKLSAKFNLQYNTNELSSIINELKRNQ